MHVFIDENNEKMAFIYTDVELLEKKKKVERKFLMIINIKNQSTEKEFDLTGKSLNTIMEICYKKNEDKIIIVSRNSEKAVGITVIDLNNDSINFKELDLLEIKKEKVKGEENGKL